MGFKNIFKDSNDLNEQSIAAFIALALVIIITIADVVTGIMSRELVVKEFIFDSLLIYSATALGVAGYKNVKNKDNGEAGE
jgi:hypothetical protein